MKRTRLRPVSAKRAASGEAPRGSTLARGAGLARRAGLQPGGPLGRTGPVRPVSARRGQENRERAAVVAALFPDRPLCVVYVLAQTYPGTVPAGVLDRCGRWADDVHEVLTRARGGSITDAANFAPPCRSCHDAITGEAPWAYQLGLLRHSWEGQPGGDAA